MSHLRYRETTFSESACNAAALYRHCVSEAAKYGYRRLELMATLPGVPFYLSMGCERLEDFVERLPDGADLPCVRMGAML